MKTTTNKHVCRPPNESPSRRKHKQTSPKTAAQTSYTTPEKCNAMHNIMCATGCGYVSILPCPTTLDIRLNATTARTQERRRTLMRTCIGTAPEPQMWCIIEDEMFTTKSSQRSFRGSAHVRKQRSGCWTQVKNTHAKKMSTRSLREAESTACATQPQE